ncbi:MAG: PSP1 domain-containing protein [Thermodesulfobacteriota bacterium]
MDDNRPKRDTSYLPRSYGSKFRDRQSDEASPEHSLAQEASNIAPSEEVCTASPVQGDPPEEALSDDTSTQVQCEIVLERSEPGDMSDASSETSASEQWAFEAPQAEPTLEAEAQERRHAAPRPSPPAEAPKVTVNVVGIRFDRAGRIYNFDAAGIDLAMGEPVVVKTEKGLGLGTVATPPTRRELDTSQAESLRKVLRKAGRVDFDQKARCSHREAEARAHCLERIEALGLPMKLVDVECFFDSSKYIFYFTAEGRVDFRELVKQLVARFPVRIEMRQIGVRHEAKMLGGIACCGQELCCGRFLSEFRPVSVKMAKNQNLSLNPTKISGCCGRLMCCLAYEHDIYEDFRQDMPKLGKRVNTPKGEGVVVKYNPLSETVSVQIDDENIIEVRKEDVLCEGGTRPCSPNGE